MVCVQNAMHNAVLVHEIRNFCCFLLVMKP